MIWLGVFVVVAIASAAQAVSGFGFALIATPVVAVLAGPRAAVVGLTMVGVLLVAQLAVRGRGHADRGVVLAVTLSAIAGMPFGILILTLASERALTVIIAIAVIGFAALLWRGLRLPRGRPTDVVAGFTAGVFSTSTGTSGPPIVIALANRSLPPLAFRATISEIFLVQGSVALLAFAVVGQVTAAAGAVALAGTPGLVIGALVGERGFRRVDPATFRRIVLAMLALSGVVSLVGALLS